MRCLLTVALLMAGLISTAIAPADASCAVQPGSGLSGAARQVDAAAVVFVGTVISTSNGDRVARVRVESVWKGGPVPMLVTVSGTPDEGSVATSVDRKFAAGRRYLFVPSNARSPFQDSNCSGTQLYTSSLDSLRPATAETPTTGTDGQEQSAPDWLWPAAGAGVVLSGGLAGWALVRRRRPIGGS